MKTLLNRIALKNNIALINFKPLSDGSINSVFKIDSPTQSFVIKINQAREYPEMFQKEAGGLELLKNSNTFRIPTVVDFGSFENATYLVLEYIPAGSPSTDFWNNFAKKLSQLHQKTQENFGLHYDNYIGSLIQKNTFSDNAANFYITSRLEPQFRMATDKGFKFQNLDGILKNIASEIPDEKPSLIHGDLWAGNYMISSRNEAVLIDPAIAFAPREMDLAMMKLFGGFPETSFNDYNSFFPLLPNWKERIKLWQLYYLLVHLNIFGAGYYRQIKDILFKY